MIEGLLDSLVKQLVSKIVASYNIDILARYFNSNFGCVKIKHDLLN